MKKVLKQYKLKDGDNYTVKWNGTEYDLQDRKNEYEIINFEKEFGNLNDFSKNLYNNVKSSNTVSVINLDADGTIYENGQVNGLNNGNANSEILDLSNYLADGKYLVINVDMSGLNTINLSNQINWGDLDGTYYWNSLSTRVLWNFYNKDSNKPYNGDIEIGKNYILGTMLAPSANVIVRTTINASIIANEASNPGGEIHKSQFASVQKLVKTKVLNKKVNPKNGSVSIRVTKVDSTNNNKLANAKFVIVVKDGEKEIARKTDVTNDLGVITLDKIEISSAGKKYTVSIKEANAPDGYNPNEDIEFEVESILKENKYVLKPVSSYNKNGDTIVVGNEYIDVTVPNLKITGTYGIKLIKRDEDTNSLLNNMTFDITAVDSNNNKVSLVSSLTGKEIDLSKLVTGEKSDDGVIEVKDINISGEQNYKLIINERLSGNYNKLEPIKVNVQTKLENGIIYDDGKIKSCENSIRRHILNTKNIYLKGVHNFENICAAIAATAPLVDIDTQVKVISEFKGVHHRLEYVRDVNGVKWYNDSASSSPTRTIAGINAFEEGLTLITGGYDKNLDYTPMAKPIVDKVKTLLLIGQTSEKIYNAVKQEMQKQNKTIEIYKCDSLQECIDIANETTKSGDIVLFSPGSASFDMFLSLIHI